MRNTCVRKTGKCWRQCARCPFSILSPHFIKFGQKSPAILIITFGVQTEIWTGTPPEYRPNPITRCLMLLKQFTWKGLNEQNIHQDISLEKRAILKQKLDEYDVTNWMSSPRISPVISVCKQHKNLQVSKSRKTFNQLISMYKLSKEENICLLYIKDPDSRIMTGCHNVQTLPHGLFHRSFLYSFKSPSTDFVCRSAAILFARCFYVPWSIVSSTSNKTV
jgi:hypothetical protein